jgi:hypothetical protein
MYKAMMRYATPFITGLFAISLVSGVALFFHLGTSYFREMHEWLSMVLIIPFVLHLLKNWRPFLMYFKHVPMAIALVLSLAAGGFYAWEGAQGGAGGNPMMAIANAMQSSSVSTVAPIFELTPTELTAALTAKGYKVDSPDSKIGDIAKASGKDGFAIIGDITSAKK